jgi:hypothetical protein
VVVYGDSFVEAEFSPREKTFVRRLGHHLSVACGRSVETVNAGVTGWGPDQVALRLQQDLGRLDPDLVVIALYAGNDLGDLVRNRLYRLDPRGTAVRSHVTLDREVSAAMDAAASDRGLLSLQVVARLLRAWRHLRFRPEPITNPVEDSLELAREAYAAAITDDTPVVTDQMIDHYDADVAVAPEAPSASYKAALLAGVLSRIAAMLGNAETSGLVVVIPPAVDVCEEHSFQADLRRWPEYSRRRLSRWSAECARASGLPVVELFPHFAGPECRDLYFRAGDNHWNDRGQERAASLVTSHASALLCPTPPASVHGY